MHNESVPKVPKSAVPDSHRNSTPDSDTSTDSDDPYESSIKAYRRRLGAEAANVPSGDRLRRARRQTADFKPGYTIRFLPDACRIQLAPGIGLNFNGDSFELECPTWEPILGPVKRVGIATDLQAPIRKKSTNKNQITIYMAGVGVYLRPKVKNPYFDLTVDGTRSMSGLILNMRMSWRDCQLRLS